MEKQFATIDPAPTAAPTIAETLSRMSTQQEQAEAYAFRQLVAHLQSRTDVQNIELMILSGFCRNVRLNLFYSRVLAFYSPVAVRARSASPNGTTSARQRPASRAPTTMRASTCTACRTRRGSRRIRPRRATSSYAAWRRPRRSTPSTRRRHPSLRRPRRPQHRRRHHLRHQPPQVAACRMCAACQRTSWCP